MTFETHHSPYAPTKEELKRLGDIVGLDFNEESYDQKRAAEQIFEHLGNETIDTMDIDIEAVFRGIAEAVFSRKPEAILEFYFENKDLIIKAAQIDSRVVEALVIALKISIEAGSDACMTSLGGMYYLGEVVPQDYHKAAELYEMAANAGNYQSTINLGYIYEYGRIGEPDYQKAYMYYSLAAALHPSSEALYKLGDQFSRGKAVEEDRQKAYWLYMRSYKEADGIEEEAQPAIRLADMLIDKGNGLYDIPYLPLRALELYQKAEIGLRISIRDGAYYYKKRLEEALAGQEKARALVCEEIPVE